MKQTRLRKAMLCVLICIKSLREVESKMVDIMGQEGHREEGEGTEVSHRHNVTNVWDKKF